MFYYWAIQNQNYWYFIFIGMNYIFTNYKKFKKRKMYDLTEMLAQKISHEMACFLCKDKENE